MVVEQRWQGGKLVEEQVYEDEREILPETEGDDNEDMADLEAFEEDDVSPKRFGQTCSSWIVFY